jgi:hypothetical protein
MSACKVCAKSDGKLFACKGCRGAIYCSQDHATQDWPTHQSVCSTINHPTVDTPVGPNTTVANYRGLLSEQEFEELKSNAARSEARKAQLKEGTYYFRLGAPNSDPEISSTIEIIYKRSGMLYKKEFRAAVFLSGAKKVWEIINETNPYSCKSLYEIVRALFDISYIGFHGVGEDVQN